MTDEEQNKLGLTDSQRVICEYFEDHPEVLARLTEALRPALEALSEIYVKISEALSPIIDTLGAACAEAKRIEEEDSEDD